MLPASATPVSVGVVTRVTLSLPDAPLSDAAASRSIPGVVGALPSMTIALLAPSDPVVPGAASVSVADRPVCVSTMVPPESTSAPVDA